MEIHKSGKAVSREYYIIIIIFKLNGMFSLSPIKHNSKFLVTEVKYSVQVRSVWQKNKGSSPFQKQNGM